MGLTLLKRLSIGIPQGSQGSNVNPIVPDGAILTEDGLFYLLTEDGLFYLKQEEA